MSLDLPAMAKIKNTQKVMGKMKTEDEYQKQATRREAAVREKSQGNYSIMRKILHILKVEKQMWTKKKNCGPKSCYHNGHPVNKNDQLLFKPKIPVPSSSPDFTTMVDVPLTYSGILQVLKAATSFSV